MNGAWCRSLTGYHDPPDQFGWLKEVLTVPAPTRPLRQPADEPPAALRVVTGKINHGDLHRLSAYVVRRLRRDWFSADSTPQRQTARPLHAVLMDVDRCPISQTAGVTLGALTRLIEGGVFCATDTGCLKTWPATSRCQTALITRGCPHADGLRPTRLQWRPDETLAGRSVNVLAVLTPSFVVRW